MKKLSDNRRNLLKFLLASPLISTAAFTQEFQMDEMDPDIQYLLN